MNRKSPTKALSLPRCRKCGKKWHPAEGVIASSSYCKHCSQDRRSAAASHFKFKRITAADLVNGYLVPRRFRQN